MKEEYIYLWEKAIAKSFWSHDPETNAAKIREQPILTHPFLVACPLSMVNDLSLFLRDPSVNILEDSLPTSVVRRVLENKNLHECFIREIPRAIIFGKMCQTHRGSEAWVAAFQEFRNKNIHADKTGNILDDEWKKIISTEKQNNEKKFKEYVKNEMLPSHVYFLTPSVIVEMINNTEYHSSFLRNIINKSLIMNKLIPQTEKTIIKVLEATMHPVAHKRAAAICSLENINPEKISKLGILISQKMNKKDS
jgi:hypothetical protein